MGGAPSPLNFSGPLGKLFGDNASFSASLEMLFAGGSQGGKPVMIVYPGKVLVGGGKSRFDVDVIKASGNQLSPQRVANMKASGLDVLVLIFTPGFERFANVFSVI